MNIEIYIENSDMTNNILWIFLGLGHLFNVVLLRLHGWESG